MNDNDQKNKKPSHIRDLLLLFSIPIAIALLAAALTYVPRALARPAYDFMYAVCQDYRCQNSFAVGADGRVAETTADSQMPPDYYERAVLRYYDASRNATRSLTLNQAQAYKLNTSTKSPDGYTLARQTGSGFFGSGYDNSWYLKNGIKKKEVELATGSSYYPRNITFLGWVTNEK